MHIISSDQFSRFYIDSLFALTRRIRSSYSKEVNWFLREGHWIETLKGSTIATVFDEPSTRTKSSFEAATLRLGGTVFSVDTMNSSMKKGETFEDTIKTISQYADVIVLRHPNVGAATLAAAVSEVPVINAGDGSGEHPTQALMDVFTITDEMPNFKKVCFFGDVEFARTVHSLEILLKNTFPEVEITKINARDDFDQENAVNLTTADVVYMTRMQRERSGVGKNAWIHTQLNPLKYMKEKSILLHPLPRAGELSVECDSDPRAAYWRQVKNGLYLRMALLKMILRP